MFSKIFQELGFSEITERVFTELVNKGPSPARILADRVGVPRPSVYDHLNMLIDRGLVAEKSADGKKVFYIDDPKNMEGLLDDKIKALQDERDRLRQSLEDIKKKSAFIEPQVRFYSGKEGVKQVLNHIMLNYNSETMLFWPMSEMMKVLGPEYLEDLNQKRVKRNIFLRAIWPMDKKLDTKKYPYLAGDEEHLRELRFAPKGMTWSMGYWMYDDKVVFLSSEKEGFGFVVRSQDFADLMRVQFEEMWKICKPTVP